MIKEIVGKKIGMTQIFDEQANLIGVTLIEIKPVCILEKIGSEGKKARIGYDKVEENKIAKKIKKPQQGYFKKLGVACYKNIMEVDVLDPNLEEKKEIGIEIFQEGERVNIRSKTKGRGFQGGVKRYGWRGGPASHGCMTHRRIGSAGATTYPGRVIKGHHMPGHMGNRFLTIRNLKIAKIDQEKGILYIKGSVPGAVNSRVYLRKAD